MLVPDAAPAVAAESAGVRSGYDPEVVAREAMSKDPGLSSGLALRLAREAGEILADEPGRRRPGARRRLLAGSTGDRRDPRQLRRHRSRRRTAGTRRHPG